MPTLASLPAPSTARPAADIAAEFAPVDGRVAMVVVTTALLRLSEYVGGGRSANRSLRAGSTIHVTYNQGATNAQVYVVDAATGKWMTIPGAVRDFHTTPAHIFAATGVELNAQRARVAANAARYAAKS